MTQTERILVKDFDEVETRFGSSFHEKYERFVGKLEREIAQSIEHPDEEAAELQVAPAAGGEHRCPHDSREIPIDQD